jgi:hypothetical protein
VESDSALRESRLNGKCFTKAKPFPRGVTRAWCKMILLGGKSFYTQGHFACWKKFGSRHRSRRINMTIHAGLQFFVQLRQASIV